MNATLTALTGGMPVEFFLFALLLAAIAFGGFNTMVTALVGAGCITLYKLTLGQFAEGTGLAGLLAHAAHEWVLLANLLGLLLGFALLARHVEQSGLPELLPKYLPDNASGGFVLLVAVFLLSSVLDNIAAAVIGAAIARIVFRNRIHVGYLASLVACANAGGVGSVLGDTTTTMMWIAGVPPLQVLPGYLAAGAALLVTAIPASLQQHALSPIVADAPPDARLDHPRLFIVGAILTLAVLTNVLVNLYAREQAGVLPFLALAVWIGILASSGWRRPGWDQLPHALQGAVFLLALVWCASLMPVEHLPPPSWRSTLGVGALSAVLDNIPLTALAIKQDGYDWGMLAYAVGFGGSMIWFGSSAGVAVANRHADAKSVLRWVRDGWHVLLAYPVGFAVMLLVLGWHPWSIRESRQATAQASAAAPELPPAWPPTIGRLSVPAPAPPAPPAPSLPVVPAADARLDQTSENGLAAPVGQEGSTGFKMHGSLGLQRHPPARSPLSTIP